jgi:hypothetical protein
VHKDARLLQLVLSEINLKEFLLVNVFSADQSRMIPVAAELLKAFQSDASFIQTLFKLLIEQV